MSRPAQNLNIHEQLSTAHSCERSNGRNRASESRCRKLSTSLLSVLATLVCKGIACAATLTPDPTPNELQEFQNLKPATNPAWVSKCVSDARKGPLVCSVEKTILLVKTSQPVASVIVRTQSETREPTIVIRVPVGLYLPAGLSFRIDNGNPQSIPLQTCDLQGCFAEMPLNSTLLAALKVGKRLSIICKNSAKNEIVLPLALDNFTEAFEKIQ
jgi:invasion protein IalB